jgi:hypothetical protein
MVYIYRERELAGSSFIKTERERERERKISMTQSMPD